MSIRALEGKVEDLVPVKNVIVSVFDKHCLDHLIKGMLGACPDVTFYSTGGTYKELGLLLPSERLVSIEDYTGSPEMSGGLVKTLHPKIHAGILAEGGNRNH